MTGGTNDRLAALSQTLDTRTHNSVSLKDFTESPTTRADDSMNSIKNSNEVDCPVREVFPLTTSVNAQSNAPIDALAKATILDFLRELQTVVAANRAGPAFRVAE